VSLLDDLRNLLARHLAHVNSQTQQGTVRWIEDHLNRLDAVVSNDIAAGEAKVHEILGELYAATNAPAPAVAEPAPAATPVADVPAPVAAPVEQAPVVPADAPVAVPTETQPAAEPAVETAPTADVATETPAV
jgi:hypothetical protein